MARAYSLDLRKKVMSFITSGGGKREASKIFGIGEDTIYRWMRREKAGDLSAKKRIDFPRKVDPEELRCYVSAHPDHTLKEIGTALHLGHQTVWTWLRRLDITRKKRPRSIKSGTKINAKTLERK